MNIPWYKKRYPGCNGCLLIPLLIFLLFPFLLAPVRQASMSLCAKKRHTGVQRRVTMCMGDAAHTGVFPVQSVRRFGSVLWSAKLQYKVLHSCIVADEDAVYFSDDWDKPYAFDRSSGTRKWAFEYNEARTSPTSKQLFGINRKTGAVLWKWHWLSIAEMPITSYLTASGDSFYFGTGTGEVFSVDIETAATNWHFKTGDAVQASPAAADGFVYVASRDGNLYALTAANGKVKWTFTANGPLASSPVVAGSLVLFRNESGNLTAVNAENGALEWNFAVNSETRSAPAVLDDTAFFGDETGRFFAVDVRTGAEKWHVTVEGGIYSAAVIADGIVYFGSRDKHLYAIEAATGELMWKYETSGAVDVSPAVADNLVVVADSEGMIYAIVQHE